MKTVIFTALCFIVESCVRAGLPLVVSYGSEYVTEMKKNAMVQEYGEVASVYSSVAWSNVDNFLTKNEQLRAYGGDVAARLLAETYEGAGDFFSSPFRCERVIMGFTVVSLL